MTEQEYIDTHDLVTMRAVKHLLSELMPVHSNIIISGQLQDIVETLSFWENKLVSEVKTTEK